MPAAPERSNRVVPLAVTAVVAVIVALAYLYVVVPWEDSWGATTEDQTLPLPGDEFVPQPYHQIHHVVAIRAAPDRIWPWLAQLGQDRAGFYSYDWLENLFLAGIRNYPAIRREWQTRQLGELVPAVQPQFMGLDTAGKVGWKVTIFKPDEALGLENWGTFALVPQADGTTRLIARQRRRGPEPALAWPVVTYLLDPAHFVMERRMLLRIKELAEGGKVTPDAVEGLAALGWLLGAALLAVYFILRRRWLSMAAALAIAALIWQQTGDALASLAGYMGLGLALLGLALFRWWAGMWVLVLGIFTFAVLALAPDAWVVFGLAFGICAATLMWRARRRQSVSATPSGASS